MEKIILKSTQKGYFSKYFWSLLWLIALWAIATWMSGLGQTVSKIDAILPSIGMWCSYAVMVIIFLSNIHTMLYSARETSTFFVSKEETLNKLLCESYGFPFSKDTLEALFDTIIEIQISQRSIDRILNTGDLTMKFVTFTNGDSEEWEIDIPAIEDPFERKEELEKFISTQRSLKVKIES